jgi:indole-3-glycerol phosphate synthase
MTKTKTILDKIVADKKPEVARIRREVPQWSLKERAAARQPLDFAAALRGDNIKLIAELKKASPSKGLLCPDFRPVELAKLFEQNGAAAISVLTESNYFQGSLDYLEQVRRAVNIPILRKDFIFDEYQLYEAAAYGADAVLLIVAILEQPGLSKLLTLCTELRLGALVEVHNENELFTALEASAEIIGINNRDLSTFKTDIGTTHRLRNIIPDGHIIVSESGIHTSEDIKLIQSYKVNAVLIGEALVTARNIPAKMKELLP